MSSKIENWWEIASAGESDWSPDGKQLAYISAENGISGDVYLYSMTDDKATRLTDDPTQAAQPAWSPDGSYILYVAVKEFGTGSGDDIDSVWAVTPAGAKSKIYTPPAYINTANGTSYDSWQESLIGWSQDHTVIVNSGNDMCNGEANVRTYDLATADSVVYWKGCFNILDMAYDSIDKVFMFSFDGNSPQSRDAQAGTYLLTSPASLVKISDKTANTDYTLADANVGWSDRIDTFFLRTDTEVLAFKPNGEAANNPFQLTAIPSVSPDQKVWAWTDDAGTYIGVVATGQVKTIIAQWSSIFWQPASSNLIMCSLDQVYVASSPQYTPSLVNVSDINCDDARLIQP
jgi:dipeptidyl aminopeptidase/acylaminoacyl peptidase